MLNMFLLTAEHGSHKPWGLFCSPLTMEKRRRAEERRGDCMSELAARCLSAWNREAYLRRWLASISEAGSKARFLISVCLERSKEVRLYIELNITVNTDIENRNMEGSYQGKESLWWICNWRPSSISQLLRVLFVQGNIRRSVSSPVWPLKTGWDQ